MDIGIKRIIDVGKAKKKLGKYLPEGEVIEDDQQLLELFEIYNRVGRNCLDELRERTKESFLQILSKEIDEELSKLLPKKPKSFSWKSLKKEKKDFLRNLYIKSLEVGRTKEEISKDFHAYLVRGKKKFEVLKQ